MAIRLKDLLGRYTPFTVSVSDHSVSVSVSLLILFEKKVQQNGTVIVLCRPRLRERLPLIISSVLDFLASQENGSAPIGDKSPPEEISR